MRSIKLHISMSYKIDFVLVLKLAPHFRKANLVVSVLDSFGRTMWNIRLEQKFLCRAESGSSLV